MGGFLGSLILGIVLHEHFLTQVLQADDAVTVGLAGSDEILWAFHRRPEPDGTLLLRFAYRTHDARLPVPFTPLGLAPVVGGIRHAVVLDRSLHVIYRDGTHKKYRPSSFVSDPWSTSTQTDERILPGSETPLALAADEEKKCLFALVSNRCGIELAKVPIAGENLPSDEPTVPLIHAVLPTNSTALVRFADGQWTLDRDGPGDLANRGAGCSMLARRDELHLFCPGENGVLDYRRSAGADSGWSVPEMLPVVLPPVKLAPGWRNGKPAILFAERSGTELHVSLLCQKPEGWDRPLKLSGETQAFSHPFGLAWFRSDPAVAWLNAGADVQVGLWSADSGSPLEPPQVVTPLVRRANPPPHGIGALLIQYIVLGALLSGIFYWRRDSLLVIAPLTAEFQLAPFSKRLAAVLIDLTLLFPVWGPVMFMMILSEGGSSWQTLMNPGSDNPPPAAALGFRPILGALFGLYGAILEGIFGATLGKRITGLRVTDYRGQRGRFAMVLIRNLARILEFNYPPLFLLVLMTPARQRIGDILAQTVVLSHDDDAAENLRENDN